MADLVKKEITDGELCSLAREATQRAYSPYSGYKVGAALLCSDGSIYLGCNIENVSFTPTVCAERTAFYKAVFDGKRDFSKIAIAGGKDGIIDRVFPPCGVCRQVMSEFCNPADFEILLVDNEGFKRFTLREILPLGFTPENLGK